MGIFGRGSGGTAVVVGGSIIEERCWDDPALDRLVDLVSGGGPARSRVDAALDHLAEVRGDPERAVQTQEAIDEALVNAVDELRAARVSLRGNAAAEADAAALLGSTLVEQAWGVRGGGWASTVSEAAWRRFHALLEEADEILREALDLVPDHAGAGVARMITARGLGLPSDDYWHRFEVACRSSPTLYPAHWAMLTALCQKWYGNHELMFDFAHKAVAKAPAGDPVGAMLPLAHVEYRLWTMERGEGWRIGRARDVRRVRRSDAPAVAAAADRFLADETSARVHPRRLEAHQLFGWFLDAVEDRSRAKEHLMRGTTRMAFLPWEYVGSRSRFATVLRRNGVRVRG